MSAIDSNTHGFSGITLEESERLQQEWAAKKLAALAADDHDFFLREAVERNSGSFALIAIAILLKDKK